MRISIPFRHQLDQTKQRTQYILISLPVLGHFIAEVDWLQGLVPLAKGLCVNIRFCYGSIWHQISFLSRWLCWHPDMSFLQQSQIKLLYQLDWTFTKERLPERKRTGTWYARQVVNTVFLFLYVILCYSFIMCDWSPRDYTSLSVHSTPKQIKDCHTTYIVKLKPTNVTET